MDLFYINGLYNVLSMLEMPCIGLSSHLLTDNIQHMEVLSSKKKLSSLIKMEFDKNIKLSLPKCSIILSREDFTFVSKSNQLDFPYSVVVIIKEISTVKSLMNSTMLRADSTLIIYEFTTLRLFHLYLEGPEEKIKIVYCGHFQGKVLDPDMCNLKKLLFRENLDFHGIPISVMYDQWTPFCNQPANPGEAPTGLFPTIFKIITSPTSLNLTVK